MLWMSFPFVTLSAKCFLTSDQCTRLGWKGASFSHPLTAAALHLLVVGLSLLVVSTILSTSSFSCCSNNSTGHGQQEQEQEQNSNNDHHSLKDKLRICVPVGLVFGAKYSVGHWALQMTPAVVYELFHAFNLLFVALFAHIILGEHLHTYGERLGVMGVVVGSMLAVVHEFNGTSLSPLAFLLNIINGALAGALVVFLRLSMLRCHGQVVQVTAFKMLIGAAALLPVCLVFDETSFAMTFTQWMWLCISSAAILVYHVSLGLLCWLSTAPTVSIVEALHNSRKNRVKKELAVILPVVL